MYRFLKTHKLLRLLLVLCIPPQLLSIHALLKSEAHAKQVPLLYVIMCSTVAKDMLLADRASSVEVSRFYCDIVPFANEELTVGGTCHIYIVRCFATTYVTLTHSSCQYKASTVNP